MNFKYIIFLRLYCWLSFATPCFLHAQSSSKNVTKDSVTEVIKTSDFAITGDGNAVNWKQTKWIELPQRHSSGVVYQTQLKLLYSDSGIYCLFHCDDNKITATLKEDFSDLWHEDVVEAFFWTDEAVPIYFEYELSPLNYELAILVPNNKGNFLGWKPWHYEGNRKTRHAVHINKQGDNILSWTAEFFIPYTLLKPLSNVPPKRNSRWRANFYRIDHDRGDSEWSWQVTGTNFHDYEKFGTLMFD